MYSVSNQSHLKEKEMQEGKMETLQRPEKKKEKQKIKEKRKDKPKWMQSSKEQRRDKKTFLVNNADR